MVAGAPMGLMFVMKSFTKTYPRFFKTFITHVHVTGEQSSLLYPELIDVTYRGIPRFFFQLPTPMHFYHIGLPATTNPYSNSLCMPGAFLHLLTTPLPPSQWPFKRVHIEVDSREVNMADIISEANASKAPKSDSAVPTNAPDGPMTGFVCGIVTSEENADGTKSLVQPDQLYQVSWNASWTAPGGPDSYHRVRFDMGADHEIIQSLKAGDMIGVWAISLHPMAVNAVRAMEVRVITAPRWLRGAPSTFWSNQATYLHPESRLQRGTDFWAVVGSSETFRAVSRPDQTSIPGSDCDISRSTQTIRGSPELKSELLRGIIFMNLATVGAESTAVPVSHTGTTLSRQSRGPLTYPLRLEALWTAAEISPLWITTSCEPSA